MKFQNAKFKKFKLSELFIEIPCKKFVISKCSKGNVPLYGATKSEKPIKYVKEISYDHDNSDNNCDTITINKNGSIGYCFRRYDKFAITQDVSLYSLSIDLTDYDLDIISIQLNHVFSYHYKINKERFNETFVYILDE